jgi:hypothetical protein
MAVSNATANMIKLGFCVAYDWPLLRHALMQVYDQADRICLSIDKDRISWSGHRYEWHEHEFRSMIREIDKSSKILIVEEDYHLLTLTPMQNEVRQRNKIADHLGAGGWHIQLDCDEYFHNFSGFVSYLRSCPKMLQSARMSVAPGFTCLKKFREVF